MAVQVNNYTKTLWAPGLPITQGRMNNIEDQIYNITEALNANANTGGLIASIDDIYTRIGKNTNFHSEITASNIIAAINFVYTKAKSALDNATSANSGASDGAKAWAMISAVQADLNGTPTFIGSVDLNGTAAPTLSEKFGQINTLITSISDTIGGDYSSSNTVASTLSSILAEFDVGGDVYQIIDEIQNARGLKNYTTGKPTASSLKDKLDDIESQINKNTQNINDNLLDVSGDYASLNARLDIYEDIKEEVETARGKDKNNDNYGNLNARLNNMLTKDDIVDDTATANVNKVLSANAGKTLQDDINAIDSNYSVQIRNATTSHTGTYKPTNLDTRFANIDGGSLPSRTLPSIITEVNDAHRAVEQGQQEDTLVKRFNDLDTTISHLVGYSGVNDKGGLTERIVELESTIDSFSSSSTIASAINNKLDKSSVEDDLTIANATGDNVYKVLHAHAGYTLNQKIDHEKDVNDENDKGGLTQRIEALETEVDMTSANSRIDLVETEVTDARTSSVITHEDEDTHEQVPTEYNDLNDRLETIETTILANNAAIDTRIDAIDGGTTPSRTLPDLITEINNAHINNGTLDDRFDTLETQVTNIANELNMTNIAGQVQDTTSRIDQLETNVVAMANEIGMLQNGAAVQDMASAITDEGTRIDIIRDEIDNAHRANVNNDTLDNRFDAIENDISHPVVEADPEHDIAADAGGLTERLGAVETSITGNGGINARLDALDTAGTGAIAQLQSVDSALDERLDAIDGGSQISTASGTLAHRVSAVEIVASSAATNSALNTLAGRVTSLENEPKSATVVIDNTCITYNTVSNQTVPTLYTDNTKTTEITPTKDADYLLQGASPDLKYYYWKYIGDAQNGAWELISGGGGSGSGNSNAEDFLTRAAFIAARKELNKDYYVQEDDGIVHHYRYLGTTAEDEPIEIGVLTSMLKSYQIARSQEVDQTTHEATEYLDLYRFNFGTNVTSDDVDTVPNYANYRIAHVELPKGGEGGGSSNHRIYARIRGDQAQRISWSTAENQGVRINYGYTCYSYNEVDGYDYLNLQATLTDENNNVIETYNVSHLTYDEYAAGNINITTKNLFQYCVKNDTKSFTLTLHNVTPTSETIPDKSLTVYITLVELALTSTFTDQQTYSINNNLTIPYQFTGMSDQNPEFEILFDGNTISATITNNNIVIRKENLANKQGVHTLTIRASQLVGGSTLYSDPLTYQLGLVSGVNDGIMLFSGKTLQTLYNEQYQLLKLPYYLYVPNNATADVSFTGERITYNNSNEITARENVAELVRPTETLSTGAYNYDFRLHDMIADIEYYIITISTGNQSLVFNITMNKAAEQINIITDNLMFDFKPERYSNNVADEELRLWSDTNSGVTYKMRIPEGAHFDWRTGGWMTDDNDVPCFCVKAGSRVEFIQEENNVTSPLTLFWNSMETTGSNFKCTFRIDNVKTPNAPFLTSLDTNVNTIVNYGKTILSEKQDVEDDKTLLSTYLNVKYIHTNTINGSNKSVKEAIGMTTLNNNPFDEQITQELRAAAEDSARAKNTKKIKQYITNIYNMANQASNQEHREYLLRLLSNKSNSDPIDYTQDNKGVTQIANDIISYLMTDTNSTTIYNRLVSEGSDSSTITYAYRQAEPVNFDAILNGFVVEGKAGKDGIIAMLQFTFVSTIKTTTSNIYNQVVSATPISTNSFDKTGTFRVTRTEILTQEEIAQGKEPDVKIYEVDMLDEGGTGTYTEIVGIRDASNTETRAYGLELNALGSNIYLPSGIVSYAHSEGDIIEFEYNVNPEISGRVNSSIIIYEDGVPSAAKLYTSRNNVFEQSAPGCLTIGSDDCDVYIYKMRLYGAALNNANILANFYADGLTTDDMISRYNRNKNLVKATTITPQLVAEECPDLRVIMIEAPNLTGGKTSFIKNTKIRQIYKNGRPEDNWVALNAYHAGQGTSSDNYGVAGRNLDIMFGFDGVDTVIVPKPQKNNYIFDPTYKSMLIKNLDQDLTNDILTAEEYEAAGYTVEYNGTGKVSFTPTSVPNNWFNIKVNIASSENTNNAFLQKRFDRYLPYETPAMVRDSKIKNDMEFFNCVVFIKETGTPSEFTEDSSLAAADRPWHFYGIGNIGDSKKTDATRVNVEGDPYEFCIEISDNGLKNSGFSSGVYYISEQSKIRSQTPRNQANGNADLDVIRTATSVHICESNEFNENGSSYTISISNPSNTVLYLIPGTVRIKADETIDCYYRFMYVSSSWTEIGEPITFTRTEFGIKYPVSVAEWTCSLNDYHKSLYDTTSGKGWDKSFEFRYDITTKDGETVARNDLEAAMNTLHQQANKIAFADMYSWIVTSTNDEFHSDLGTWFIEKAPLYWYLFTERYTMIDSRAKNTFYHFGKTYISQSEYDGDIITELTAAAANPAAYATAHNITANGNVTAEQIAAQEIQFRLTAAQFIYDNRDTFELDDTQAAINNGYRFDLWDYDNDTALGINNNGQMVFSAGLEDIDKDISGWIYNEAESVIWRRIRENMYNELGALYVQCKGECFNAENLIQEFDRLQAQFPEELWRLDFERKYYRPFISKGETTYLNDMANGRKKYQRRQFERNMAIYINSKYQRNGSYDPEDIISFRPQFTWTAGRNTIITVKPYSTMYINFMMGNDDNTGNDTLVSTRVQRGEAYTIDPAQLGIHDFNNIQCIIYNASRIMELDGLGNFECKQFILGSAKKLSVLKLGSTDYINRSMENINNMGLSAGLPLLEELDLTNIQFGTAPDTFALDNFPLLKKLNATGCNIRSFTFKDGGMLENIIFPSVLTKIDFSNLYHLVDTQLANAVTLTGASNLVSYNSVNSYSNSYQIVQNMLNNAGINGITQLTLNDIEWTIQDLTDLEQLITLQKHLGNKMHLGGSITVTGKWSQVKLTDYITVLGNDIAWTMTSSASPEYKIDFYLSSTDAANENIEPYYTMYRAPDEGDVEVTLGDDPVYTGDCLMPTKEPTISRTYFFGPDPLVYDPWTGWYILNNSAQMLSNNTIINSNIKLVAIFGDTTRLYPLCWYLHDTDTEAVKIINDIPYGSTYEDALAPTVLDLKKANKPTYTIDTSDGINCTYSIFTGWKKQPINLDETFFDAERNKFCIYGNWDDISGTESIDSIKNSAVTDAKKLLVLTNTNTAANRAIFPEGSTIDVQMGYDNNTGTTLVGPGATEQLGAQRRIYNGSGTSNPILSFTRNNQGNLSPTVGYTSIQPFSEMVSRGFTIAIDYQINTDYLAAQGIDTGYIIIAGSHSKTNADAQGFAVYYDVANQVTKVCFGDLTQLTTYSSTTSSGEFKSNCTISSINSKNSRNVVVIRHVANTNKLLVYSGISAASGLITSLNSGTMYQEIGWSKNTSTAPLCFGHFTSSNFTALSAVQPGFGVSIHWAKYWNTDLGRNECTQLASWPHENIRFALEEYSGETYALGETDLSILNTASKNMVFTALSLSQYGGSCIYNYSTAVGTEVSWSRDEAVSNSIPDSTYKIIANQRFFLGLPIELQSIISVTYNKASVTKATRGISGNYWNFTSSRDSSDYCFLPTYAEVGGSISGNYSNYSNEAKRPMSLISATNTYVVSYDQPNFDFENTTQASSYMKLRFFGVPINIGTEENHVYINYNGSDPVYNKIIANNNQIRTGDIFVKTTIDEYDQVITKAYIYADEIAKAGGAPTIIPTSTSDVLYCTRGGWVPAGSWWLRTPTSSDADNIIRINQQPFFYINGNDGTIVAQGTPEDGGAYFVYSFGI